MGRVGYAGKPTKKGVGDVGVLLFCGVFDAGSIITPGWTKGARPPEAPEAGRGGAGTAACWGLARTAGL